MYKFAEILKEFEGLGWVVSKDSIGDRSIIYVVNEQLHLQSHPVLREIRKLQFLEGYFSVSRVDFDYCYTTIAKERKPINAPIISKGFQWEKKEFVQDDFVRISTEVIQWAKKQSIDAGLLKYRKLPTSAVGTLPVMHLAALALAKDVAKLNYYLECFKAGNSLGFVPYITQEYIERAIKCASS